MILVGIDEVGRGAFAGPVVAGALALDYSKLDRETLAKFIDSKDLSAKQRDTLAPLAIQNCISYGIGIVSNKQIDSKGIVPSTKYAMLLALTSLISKLNCGINSTKKINRNEIELVIDALALPINLKQTSEFKAENKYPEVAGASIIAKVFRDNYMCSIAPFYPEYKLEKNKGYGTKEHRDALANYGAVSSIHRQSFVYAYVPSKLFEPVE